jgi:hypothetical protein
VRIIDLNVGLAIQYDLDGFAFVGHPKRVPDGRCTSLFKHVRRPWCRRIRLNSPAGLPFPVAPHVYPAGGWPTAFVSKVTRACRQLLAVNFMRV